MAEVYVRTGPSLTNSTGGVLITLDASTSQTHERSAEPTEHPVEQGVDVTDHVHPGPVRVTVAGVISATPLGSEGESAEAGREIDGWAVLEQLIEDRLPVTLITTLRVYPNMVITALTAVREGGVRAVFPQLQFTQIRVVTQQVVTLPPEIVRAPAQKATAPKTVDVGRQPTTVATPQQQAQAQQAKSWAASIVDALF